MKKILKLDSSFQVINGDGIEILDTLPKGIYELKFAQMRGFWFERTELEAFKGKVYGSQHRVEEKVVRRYAATTGRNLGVLLSGEKGTGKSLFVKNLAVRLSSEMPVIIVKDNYGKGMLSTIADVRGRCVIVFDEFEKMFRKKDSNSGPSDRIDDDIREQESALSFFDGVEVRQEKLLLLTVNETWNMSKYLLGRPGRIHYHFKMTIPSYDEIREYLADNLVDKKDSAIQDVASQLTSRAVSWDSLAAVVTELNSGETLEDTLMDLNIRTDYGDYLKLTLKAVYENGKSCTKNIECREHQQEYHTTFAVDTNPDECGVDVVWTDVSIKFEDLVPTGKLGEFRASRFEQKEAEDREDKKVPKAPKVSDVFVYRTSIMNGIHEVQNRRNLSLLF